MSRKCEICGKGQVSGNSGKQRFPFQQTHKEKVECQHPDSKD